MTEQPLVLHFATRDEASRFARSVGARASRGIASHTVRVQPDSFPHRLRLRLAAMDAGSITDPTAPHGEWRHHG